MVHHEGHFSISWNGMFEGLMSSLNVELIATIVKRISHLCVDSVTFDGHYIVNTYHLYERKYWSFLIKF